MPEYYSYQNEEQQAPPTVNAASGVAKPGETANDAAYAQRLQQEEFSNSRVSLVDEHRKGVCLRVFA